MNRFTKYFALISLVSVMTPIAFAQDNIPKPSAPRQVTIPMVKEKDLANGLKVVVVEKRDSPLITAQLLVRSGARSEDAAQAGLANMTAGMLTKGTKTRTATQIAEAMEFLGGSINSGAGWNSSSVSMTVTSDKIDKAMPIMADVVLNPSFKQDELDLLKSQTLDGLTYNLTQPGFLSNYVASKYSYGEHPAGGTPKSIEAITRDDVMAFHKEHFVTSRSVLIITGDIVQARANALVQQYFGRWAKTPDIVSTVAPRASSYNPNRNIVGRILVVDLPNSGQASVKYLKKIDEVARRDKDYYPASVLNSLLGGGYSSRLNQEIRIKRGLSYGAGSGFAWRGATSNFSTSTQTKNESAAEVAELVEDEIKRLGDKTADSKELGPRKLVLTGAFGSALETTGGITGLLSDLYTFWLPADNLNTYMGSINAVNNGQVRDFAFRQFRDGDIVIVGDSKMFMADLRKRFPRTPIEVINSSDLDMESSNLKKGD